MLILRKISCIFVFLQLAYVMVASLRLRSTSKLGSLQYKSIYTNQVRESLALNLQGQSDDSNLKSDGRSITPIKSKSALDVGTGYIEAEGSGSPCRIKVIGVGGGGGNAVNRMLESSAGLLGVECWTVNTDVQALSRSLAPKQLIIGATTSRGLGAGGSPAVGAEAADESREEIMEMVGGADLVFVTAGMGGGTGSGAAPIVAECAKQAGALTVGVVTKPFGFEGRKRMEQALKAIKEMKGKVDTLIVVSNDKLLEIVPENTPLTDAFLVADDILRQGVVGISEIIIKPGLVNVDFADVRSIMGNAGTALMGIGQGKGKTRAQDAAMAAISSPLLGFPITKAKGIVFNIVGGSDMTLQEINSAAEVIYENVDQDANIIFGALVDDRMDTGEVSITVLATGFATDFFDQDDPKSGSSRNDEESSSSGSPASSLNPMRTRLSSPPSAVPLKQGNAPLRQKLPTSLNPISSVPSSRNRPIRQKIPTKWEDEDEYREDEGFDEDEYEEPVKPRGGRRKVYDDYDDNDDDDFEEEEYEKPRRRGKKEIPSGRVGEKKKKRGGIRGFFRRLFGRT